MKTLFAVFLLIFANTATAGLCKTGEKPKGPAHGFTAPGYNWCGPGYKGRQSCWVNETDRICRIHDLCEYQNVRAGKPAHSCECDLAFIRAAQGVAGGFAWIIRQRNSAECLSRL